MNYIVIYSLNNYIVYLVNIEIIMETKVIENIELLKKLAPYLKEETEIKNSYTYPVNEIKKSGSFDYLYSEAGEKDYISVK